MAAVATYLGLLVLRRTTRSTFIGADDAVERVRRGEPVLIAFWHDHLLGMALAYGGGPLHFMASWHRDGEIATRCVRRLGLVAVRGSSTRGWMGATRRLLEALRSGHPSVVVPDGPKGPRHEAKVGVVELARATGAEILPLGFAAAPGWRAKSWDRLLVPFPFARVVFAQGQTLRVERDASPPDIEACRRRLEEELERAGETAAGHVAVSSSRLRVDWGAFLLALAYDGVMRLVAFGAGALQWLSGTGAELAERLAHYPQEVIRQVQGRRTLWLHAASVGEMQGIRALLEPLRQRFPGYAIVVSAATRTGRAVAHALPGVDAAVYLPLDARPVVRRALAAFRPRLFVFTETELWPGLLRECAQRTIPCVLVSGRVSARAASRYAWFRPLMRRTLARVRMCMQSTPDAERIISLGAEPGRVTVLGNLKSEAPMDENLRAHVAELWNRNGVTTRALLIGASTHRGEEDALLDAFARIDSRSPEARLVLAPRHPERFEAVARLLERAGAAWVRFSALEEGRQRVGERRIVLLDRIGMLRACFPFARLVFVGGTLAAVGGHNVLEPAAEGCAVVFGPHTAHVADMVRGLLATGGGRQVADAAELARVVEALLPDVAAAARMGARAVEAAAQGRGAVARHMDVIASMLDGEPVHEGMGGK